VPSPQHTLVSPGRPDLQPSPVRPLLAGPAEGRGRALTLSACGPCGERCARPRGRAGRRGRADTVVSAGW